MNPCKHFVFFWKRNIKENILKISVWKAFSRRLQVLLLVVLFIDLPIGLSSCSHGKDMSKRKMEKQNARKAKESQKNYEKILKQHQKNQSATTRAMMNETNKSSPKNTPLKKSSGKKCKQK
jgi:hypothetical protein